MSKNFASADFSVTFRPPIPGESNPNRASSPYLLSVLNLESWILNEFLKIPLYNPQFYILNCLFNELFSSFSLPRSLSLSLSLFILPLSSPFHLLVTHSLRPHT